MRWWCRYAGLMSKDDYAKKRSTVETQVEEQAESYEARQVAFPLGVRWYRGLTRPITAADHASIDMLFIHSSK